MSFSSETKNELCTHQIKRRCCRQAFLAGLLFDAETDGDGRVLSTFSSEEAASCVVKTAVSVFGSDAIPNQTPMAFGGNFDVAIVSSVAAKVCGALPAFKCAECSVHFLRGLIVSLASITSPASQYHLEFLLTHKERFDTLFEYLSDGFGAPITVSRKHGIGLVYKNSSVIEEIISTSGAMQAYFEFVNGKIERDLRNNANRATNCETGNISRAVKASAAQLEAIQILIDEGELDKLPLELRETAQLRILYPDIPMSELAARHCPPISKSGINHRISKLLDAAKKLK